MFPANGECLIGISDAFFAFCLRVSVILPTCSLYPQQKLAYSALHPQALTYIYSSMPVGTYRLPKIVYSRFKITLLSHQRNSQKDRMASKSSSHHQRPVSRKLWNVEELETLAQTGMWPCSTFTIEESCPILSWTFRSQGKFKNQDYFIISSEKWPRRQDGE